jgi:hypothetical protein
MQTEAQFIVPDWGDKVDYGKGLSHRFVSLYMFVSICSLSHCNNVTFKDTKTL